MILLLLLIPLFALMFFIARSLLTAKPAEKALGSTFFWSIAFWIGAYLSAAGIAWVIGATGVSDPLGMWKEAWEEGRADVLLVSSVYYSILPLIVALSLWRIYRSGEAIESVEVTLEFPFNLFFDEEKGRCGILKFFMVLCGIGFLAAILVAVTSAIDLAFDSSLRTGIMQALKMADSGASFIADLIVISGNLFGAAVISWVVWSAISDGEPEAVIGLGILFGLFALFAWVTGQLDEVGAFVVDPFHRMWERFFE